MTRGIAPRIARSALTTLAALAIAGSPCACVATASPPPPRGMVVSGPPPPPMHEVRTAPPSDTAVWLDGYWHWTGARYSWIPGHWENAPPGSTWYGPRYVTSDGTTTYEPGSWRRGAGPNGNGNANANASVHALH